MVTGFSRRVVVVVVMRVIVVRMVMIMPAMASLSGRIAAKAAPPQTDDLGPQ